MMMQSPAMMAALDALREGGLNHWGAVSTQAYDDVAAAGLKTSDLAPGARSILVFASGGTALWDDMLEAMGDSPEYLTEDAHPLDACVGRLIGSVSLGGLEHRWFLATATAPVQLDFRTLAVLAGLGSPSRLGLVIDPILGPWMGLRAACFLSANLPTSPPAPDVCEGCSAPCVSACPAGALNQGRWDVAACADHHQSTSDCSQTCHSRVACPVGSAHRYTDLQRRYHYDRAGGRGLLREKLGIPDAADNFQGVGPHWGAWSGE
jgi:hypothetical protein